MVIGRRCQNVPAARAFEVVAGFTIVDDVSARDWQWRTPTFTVGKSFDTHAPCGPELVTLDELGDPGALTDSDLGERRAPPGLDDRGHDLRLPSHDRLPLRPPSRSSPAR